MMIIQRIVSLPQNLIHKYRLSQLSLRHKGTNVQIAPNFCFYHAENLSIGDNVYIGPYSYINAMGGVTICSGTIIGPRLTIYSANHHYRNAAAIPYDDVVLTKKVELGENIWVGGNVIIVPGVTLGEGCIVGAGSVVTRSFPPCYILGGNPAQQIGMRDEDHYRQQKAQGLIYLALKSSGHMRPHLEDEAK